MMKPHKLIPIHAWAARRYDPPPSLWLLRKWARNHEFSPPAERVGKEWYVREDARRVSTPAHDDAAAAAGVSLAELVSRRTGVVSRHLVHHVNPWGNAPAGSPVFPDRISKAFTAARALAGIPDEGAPTFHEIRSLAKRMYTAQGNVDTKALLGHATDRMAALYADPRGAEPVRVRVA